MAGRAQLVRFHDLRYFAATMFAATGASTEELMNRGGWKSVAMVVHYEHTSDEPDALTAQELNRYAEGANVVLLEQISATRSRTTTLGWKVRCWTYRR